MPYKMPNVQKLLVNKKLYDNRKDPVWVYLEREMRQNEDKKPYNEKVGDWLRYLRELRQYKHRQALKERKTIEREVGPIWYTELSSAQRDVLKELRTNIHQDLIEGIPKRTRKSLSDLGVTAKVPKDLLLNAMENSIRDPGIFIWHLYSALYKHSPNEMRQYYDMDAKILMSSLVFIDLEECVVELQELTENRDLEPPPKPKPKKKNTQPDVKYGVYLQKCYVPEYRPKSVGKKKPPPITYKFKLRSEGSMENICKDNDFMKKRVDRNRKAAAVERVCNYKFWEPPSTLRNSDPKMVAYIEKLKMLKQKAKPKYEIPFQNVQYTISGVAFTGGKPNYVLQCVSILPSGYIPINAGMVDIGNDTLTTHIAGYWKYPNEERKKCDITCDCIHKWETAVMDYIHSSRCTCGHLYDFYNEGKPTEKYLYKATRHGTHWFDEAKIYQMDPMEDFIKDAVEEAVRSKDPTPAPSEPTISAAGLKEEELLGAFLADLSKKPLLIPHLPQSNLLHNLQAWVRKRVKGSVDPKTHKEMMLKSLRRWLQLRPVDFRARAYFVPFTHKQLHNFNWSHRKLVQKLFKLLQTDFVNRNRQMQLEQTRLWWSTMKFDNYPSKAFLDIFFTYMPGRMKDTYVINPYSSELTPKSGGKTCPLR